MKASIKNSKTSKKICFIQPNTNYGVIENRFAIALTFPTIASAMKLQTHEYEIFVDGITDSDLSSFLITNEIGFAFITSITCNFPRAVELANICNDVGCITVLGGIFATMNFRAININFTQFNVIVTGNPTNSLMSNLIKIDSFPTVIHCGNGHIKTDNIAEILVNSKFVKSYPNCKVCYEIISGCDYNCTFCTLKHAWKKSALVTKSQSQIKHDLFSLSSIWKKLKIIDEDILQKPQILYGCSFAEMFDEIIVETRIDRINETTISLLKTFGVTHLVFGVETFSEKFLNYTQKSSSKSWESMAHNAIALCAKYSIIARPIVMLTALGHSLDYLYKLITKISSWNKRNGVDVLFAFYTPHPGLKDNLANGILLNNDLSLFDHINLVFLPDDIPIGSISEIVDIYNTLVMITDSEKFNPPLSITCNIDSKYSCFFAS